MLSGGRTGTLSVLAGTDIKKRSVLRCAEIQTGLEEVKENGVKN